MKNIATTLLLFLLISFKGIMAQTASISGKVMSDNKPIKFASILLNETDAVTGTDSSGFYILNNVKVGTNQIQVSYLGFAGTTSVHPPVSGFWKSNGGLSVGSLFSKPVL